mgnify:CR=1 FL=1
MKQEKNGTWTSWNENLTYKYKSLYKVTSEKELQEIVKNNDKSIIYSTRYIDVKPPKNPYPVFYDKFERWESLNKITTLDGLNDEKMAKSVLDALALYDQFAFVKNGVPNKKFFFSNYGKIIIAFPLVV